jgi:hypothetical protein
MRASPQDSKSPRMTIKNQLIHESVLDSSGACFYT